MNKSKSGIVKVQQAVNKLGAWFIVIILSIVLSIISKNFLTLNNVINVVRQVSVTAIVGLGVSFVVLGGEIDLSTGMMATFAGTNAALLTTKQDMNTWLAILIAILIGGLIGCFSGVVVTYLKVPSFITTLAMQYVINGLILLTTKSMPVTGIPDNFVMLGRGYIGNVFPVPVLIMLVLFAIGAFVLKYTIFGRSVLAVGEKPEVARLSGISVNKTRVLMFIVCGVCAAAAGIVMTGRLNSGQPTSGQDLALEALAAVYIGGTFSGSMLNTLAGALTWGIMNNGLNILGVGPHWQKIILGFVIIAAVLLDIARTRISAKQSASAA
ncbi:MAG: ABC transporter permease [Clostridiaceae bacterium]|nr:ABC transporter permease [Clostridiaceae bacterium]